MDQPRGGFTDEWRSMDRWQQVVLVSLGALVVALAAIALALAGGGDERTAAPGSTVTTTTTATSTTATPSTTTTTEPPTTTSTEPPTTTTIATTTTTVAPESVLTMRPDGLGEVLFGDDADAAVAALSAVLGEPSDDTGWLTDAETCIGSEVRFVTWGSLRAFFSDGPSDWAPAGVRHFASYDQSPAIGSPLLELQTTEGVGIGSPVGDVRAIYGDDAVITGDPLFGDLFQVVTSGAGYLWGLLTGPDATDTVASISGGFSCGE